jgi:lipoprotein-releasing system ATP-binding protein
MADGAKGPVVRVASVTKEFGERVVTRVLHGIDLVLEHGEFAALVGPSGCGKSTLLNLIGLLDRPTTGKLFVEERDTTDLDDVELTRYRGRTLGFIFQFHHLLPDFTALENVMLPAWADAGYPEQESRQRAEALLREVGVGPKMNARATDLSGGQQQRVAIARALAHGPALVLADEPTGNLDTESSQEAFALMRRFNRERGTTFLIVTHDRAIAAKCDRTIEMVDGRIVADRKTPPT